LAGCINERVSLRSLVTAATSIAIAIALSVMVPVAQLHIADDQPTCCCPNPSICNCKGHDTSTPSMKACRGTPQDLVRADLPVFVPPAVIAVARPDAPIVVAMLALPLPHPAPAPRRPDAPS
jgi:hypothetical protein